MNEAEQKRPRVARILSTQKGQSHNQIRSSQGLEEGVGE